MFNKVLTEEEEAEILLQVGMHQIYDLGGEEVVSSENNPTEVLSVDEQMWR